MSYEHYNMKVEKIVTWIKKKCIQNKVQEHMSREDQQLISISHPNTAFLFC